MIEKLFIVIEECIDILIKTAKIFRYSLFGYKDNHQSALTDKKQIFIIENIDEEVIGYLCSIIGKYPITDLEKKIIIRKERLSSYKEMKSLSEISIHLYRKERERRNKSLDDNLKELNTRIKQLEQLNK